MIRNIKIIVYIPNRVYHIQHSSLLCFLFFFLFQERRCIFKRTKKQYSKNKEAKKKPNQKQTPKNETQKKKYKDHENEGAKERNCIGAQSNSLQIIISPFTCL